MLADLHLKEVYDSSEHDLLRELQVPLLTSSTSYLRGVGYFSSGWMRLAAAGLQGLIENGGRARIVISPILSEEDWEAIQRGHAAQKDDVLIRSLNCAVDEIAAGLERDTLNTLAWMVSQDLVTFRFAIERSRSAGDYHDKVGVFEDSVGDIVAIHGSFNDSIKATMNGEAFSVFASWIPGQQPFVDQHRLRLERLWGGGNDQFETCAVPEAIRTKIVRLRESSEPPYIVGNSGRKHQAGRQDGKQDVVTLRPYQTSAVDAWVKSGFTGIFEMATGTGKTITALSAGFTSIERRQTKLILILVPYLHLMEQWGVDARKFGLHPLYCSGEDSAWPRKLRVALADAALGQSGPACIIAVHKTAATHRFADMFKRVDGDKMLLIADEVHSLGAANLRQGLLGCASMRLGLSATPRRWFDEEGTAALESYFGGTCFELPLEQAIGSVLTPYEYRPQLINLDSDELARYQALSHQIASLLPANTSECRERMKLLLLKRAQIIAAARAKLPALLELLSGLQIEATHRGAEIRDILVYAPVGHHAAYLRAVASLGLRCHEFVHDVPVRQREQVLRQFASGQIQILVAMKCLDEGVDVPSTRTAFVLASSTNPREFVQRRGRILRQAPGKHQATVYDFLVVPQVGLLDGYDEACRSLLRREMPRFAEFASSCLNEFEARNIVRPLLDRYEMLPLLDKRPWEIYQEVREREWEAEHGE